MPSSEKLGPYGEWTASSGSNIHGSYHMIDGTMTEKAMIMITFAWPTYGMEGMHVVSRFVPQRDIHVSRPKTPKETVFLLRYPSSALIPLHH